MTILTRNYANLVLEVKAHVEADALTRGKYWDGSKGCFIGCLTHSQDPKPAIERFGLPESLLRIAENIFEALPEYEGKAFFAALPDAVGCDGKDLTRVHWRFLALELRTLPQQDVIDAVIEGMDLLVAGENWSNAADAAYSATRAVNAFRRTTAAGVAANAAANAAYSAYYTGNAARAAALAAYTSDATRAVYAAHATRYAADATRSVALAADATAIAARIQQRDSLLNLIKQAPMGE